MEPVYLSCEKVKALENKTLNKKIKLDKASFNNYFLEVVIVVHPLS